MRATMILAAALSAALFAFEAEATQFRCGSHDAVKSHLNRKAQNMVASAITVVGLALEVYASQDGHYSIVLIRTDGFACITGHGENWRLQQAEYGQAS